ncbi:MAG: ribonuclease III [Nitriliruptorales bacterium]|nr:ribonuclease III [Nitriliruptorales bacterium]
MPCLVHGRWGRRPNRSPRACRLPDADLAPLVAVLGVPVEDPRLLWLSLTHRSYAFEAGGLPTNERLEFLGDAVLGLVITDEIYARFPDEAEGRLAKIRAAAVNTQSLADTARDLGLGEHVLLGRGEQQSGGRDKDSILADTMEAVFGAVYLDQGLDTAAALIRRLFASLLDDLATRRASLDYKTSLQELTAARLSSLPVYELSESGPDHDKRFKAVVLVDDEPLGRGTGRSKKEAEQAAAQQAYDELRRRMAVGSAPSEGAS